MKNKLFFSLSFCNQDVYYVELDSIQDKNELWDKIGKSRNYMRELRNPEKIIIHLEQTVLTHSRVDQIIELVEQTRDHYSKLCFVGVHGINRWILRHKMKQSLKNFTAPWSLNNDYQKAKEWIVSNGTK